ncbi:hypothetical protein Aau02nite_74910 [Amorphoplanes auranticolor]|uniref:Uncharacterized protein n=1 Tax=Actinoplanes auranticolor TaxID=47988 RepID=A0A919VVD7_9ACTN|nr:hypothetical protein Aau02nite_74910 [Actinoplanes auranticolor]
MLDVADLPLPGSGRTLERFERLATLARHDPVLARLSEGHADAAAIRAELGDAGPPAPDQIWGVWAAAPASVTARDKDGEWALSGDRPWCSGAGTRAAHARPLVPGDLARRRAPGPRERRPGRRGRLRGDRGAAAGVSDLGLALGPAR